MYILSNIYYYFLFPYFYVKHLPNYLKIDYCIVTIYFLIYLIICFSYDANDGSSRREEGKIQNLGTDQAALDILGTVRWYDKKGTLYQMTYKADKRGYRTIIKKLN